MKPGIADAAISLGLPVFPCGADKRPAIAKADGGRGFHDATRDPVAIHAMFARRNAVLVGVPTGELSGFDALDFDYRNGADAWEQANAHHLPQTRTHQTKSGGRHLLFQHAPGVRNSACRIGAGIDVRGQGGYCIFPPSTGYSVICGAPIAHWPDWLLPLVLPPPEKPRPHTVSPPCDAVPQARVDRIIAATLDRVRMAPEGGKHFTLRNAALLLGGIADQAGIADADVTRWLLRALPASVRDWRGAETTAAWGLENGRARPINIPDDPAPKPPDPRRRETARAAFRLLRMGAPSAALLAALHDHNRRRRDPLPAEVIDNTALWAARQQRERARV